MADKVKKILVTGATGYVGGRLVPRLLDKGYQVRLLVRDVSRLQGRSWLPQVEVVEGDVLVPETLPVAFEKIDVTYYLVHSMSGSAEFHERDLQSAENFGLVASRKGVQRIIYLGGLGNPDAQLSDPLRSRPGTGSRLRQAGVQVTEFRAAVIVGSGSLSFEMIRYLTEPNPVMICPRWVISKIQPIAIRNVLEYMVSALDVPESTGMIIEIGGQDILTYAEMMLEYARIRGLKRWLITVPVLTPYLSSYWVHWMTPIPAAIARPLIESLRNEVIVQNNLAESLFPDIHPLTYHEAVERALVRLDAGKVETAWTDALISSQADDHPMILNTQDGMIVEHIQKMIPVPTEKVYKVFSGLGGARGWLYFNWAWEIRGLIDRMIGGVGLRRGRRDPDHVRVGDALDFWRVEAVEPNHRLLLRAEMKVPGRAWLQFEAHPVNETKTYLNQTAFFAPKGLSGILYWYSLYPIHKLIFSGMIKKIAKRAVEEDHASM